MKGEVCGCDLVALRGDEPPVVVIGELKLRLILSSCCKGSTVPRPATRSGLLWGASARGGRENDPRVRKLCRFLGFGLLAVVLDRARRGLFEPRGHGVRAAIRNAVHALFANTGAATAIRRRAVATKVSRS